MTLFSSVSELLSHYPADCLIVDLWGVIHDGVHPYPGVEETLSELKKQKKKILFLSNAPRRAARAIEVLHKMGITEEYYDHVLTSGEATFEFVRERLKEFQKDKYFYIGPDRDLG